MKNNNAKIICKPSSSNLVPGGIYLCQVDHSISCGACCGLYNVIDTSRDSMAEMLFYRTERFKSIPRTADAIDAFAQHIQAREPRQRPFVQFHHCPFIGLIGDKKSRVGCLLHPLGAGNDGRDYRGLSYYGGLACHTYFCPATRELRSNYKQILRCIFNDWHLYGLVVTEKELVTALFEQIEGRLNHPVEANNFSGNSAARASLVALFELKLIWPHRPTQANTPCHHFFFDVSYSKPAINYNELGAQPSPYDAILRELVSEFKTVAELRAAEQLLDQRIMAVVTQTIKNI